MVNKEINIFLIITIILTVSVFSLSADGLLAVEIESMNHIPYLSRPTDSSINISTYFERKETFFISYGLSSDSLDQKSLVVRAAKREGKERPYDFIEVMACRGGCIAGGGQPYGTEDEVRDVRTAGIYSDDKHSAIRCSHNNPEIIHIYDNFLEKPLSHKSHQYLHTHYEEKPVYKK